MMKPKMVSEIQNDHINVLLESLRSSGDTFTEWPRNMLDKFRDHFKFLLFKNKQQLTKRGEPVDFIGCVVEGSANVILEHKTQAILKKGEFIGYMNAIGMQGCEVQQFDIFAKEDGCIAILKKDDLRKLSKREPEFCHHLHKTMALKCLNTISHQYFDKDYQTKTIHTSHHTSNNKIIQYLDKLGLTKTDVQEVTQQPEQNFRAYWNQLDQRDKRVFVQFCNLLHLNPTYHINIDHKESLIKSGQKGKDLFIIVEGALHVVGDQKNVDPSVYNQNREYKLGELIGLKEFFTDEVYKETVEAQQKCLIIRVSKQNMTDMFYFSSACASNILCMLTRYESTQVRQEFLDHHQHNKFQLQHQVESLLEKLKNPDKPIAKKELQTLPQLMTNYFELDIKKSDLLHVNFGERHQEKSTIAPLYVLDTYKELIAMRAYQSNQIKDVKDPMVVTGLSWFLREKTEELHNQMIKAKEEAKRQKKAGKNQIIEKQRPTTAEFVGEKDVYEELNHENDTLKSKLHKAHEYIALLEQYQKEMKEQHKQKSEDHQILNTQVKKNEMHRQLLRLDLGSGNVSMTKHSKTRVTMFDTFKQQAQDARKFQTTINAANKLLNFVHHI